MLSAVSNKCSAFKANWKQMTFKQKMATVVAINIAIPYVPILMGLTAWLAPPEVMEHVMATGGVFKELVGNSWQLASYHFMEMF